MMKKLDYIILCHQRSGSHLLCTLINSHPDIACIGETNEKMPELYNAKGKIVGKIEMYNRVKDITKYKNVKIIHLIRNPYDTARSDWINCTKKFPAHVKEKSSFEIKLNKKEIEKRAIGIEEMHNKFKNLIKNLNHIEIHYDDLSKNKSVSEINESIEYKILDFLNVSYSKLSTNLKKPKWIYK